MRDESLNIILRRSLDRFLETGLLVLAVALGIGAASAGISLLANTINTSRKILDSPGYKELVVSTSSDADDMVEPVSLRPVTESAVLTSEDLNAAELAPGVTYAYVQNRDRLHLINEEAVTEVEPESEPASQEERPSQEEPSRQEGPDSTRLSTEDLIAASADSNVVISELDEMDGYAVTTGFFDSRNLELVGGSLFSTQDMTGNGSLVILGEELATNLLPGDDDISELLGKQILAREGLVQVIGIYGGDDSDRYYTPYRSTATGDNRRRSQNTQLKFYVGDTDQLDATSLQLQNWFDKSFGEEQVAISNPRAEAKQLISRNTGLSLLIMILSLSGLFIASVNVSNILMSRAMRMKKHVGILMALGASRQRISRLFALESAGITIVGAALGCILSLPLSRSMQASLNIEGGTWLFTLLGVVISALLTLGFGLMPARQFSKIDPALAMRAA